MNIKIELFRNRLIKPSPDGRYLDCWYWTKGKNKDGYGAINGLIRGFNTDRVHRIAAHLWLDFDLKSKLQVLHKCDNPPCFNPDHLFIGTQKDNMKDKSKKNRSCRGENQHLSKLKEDDVVEIRNLFKNGMTRKQIATKFNVSNSLIVKIISGDYWRHLL